MLNRWEWPKHIQLKPIEDGTLGYKVWNPRTNPYDRTHLMPVITPAYPSMNSTYNVTHTTLSIMRSEFARGLEITSHVEQKSPTWESLFDETEFFVQYSLYLQIEVAAENDIDHRAWYVKKYCCDFVFPGLVELSHN